MRPMQLAPLAGVNSKPTSTTGSRVALFGAQVLVGSLFVALCSHLAFPVPFTPVPFTMQPFAVLLIGMLFGPSVGFATLLVYLCEGASGLPVFTPLGLPGVARLLGPTGGYLLSYPMAAALAGGVRTLRSGTFLQHLACGAAALTVIYTCGTGWLAYSQHVPYTFAMLAAVVPFAAPDCVKLFAATGLAMLFQRGTTRS